MGGCWATGLLGFTEVWPGARLGGGAVAEGAVVAGGLLPVPGTGVITTLPFTDLINTWPLPPLAGGV